VTAPARPDALGVECPYCHTPIGWPCRDYTSMGDTVRYGDPHAARIRAAEKAREEGEE